MREDQIIIGGQAVIEGVMMRSPHSYAVVVRRADGQVVTKSERLPVLSQQYPLLRLPILRGAAVLIQSMVLGIKSLNFSANVAFDETQKQEAGREVSEVRDLKSTSGLLESELSSLSAGGVASTAVIEAGATTSSSAAQALAKAAARSSANQSRGVAVAGSMVFAVLLNIALFILLPLLLTNVLFVYFGGGTIAAHSESGAWYAEVWAWLRAALHPVRPSVWFNLVDGLIRMSFFLVMITSLSVLREIRRVFEYHGAEHKVVYTWEAGEDLTVENARGKRRQHPRCGTSFLMVVMLVAIVAFSVVKFDSLVVNFLTRIALIPVIAGTSYEIIRASAFSRNQAFLSVITQPGLWLQNITTKEPDDSQLEVAILALKESLKLEPVSGAEQIALAS